MKRIVEKTAEAHGTTAAFTLDPYSNQVTYTHP